MIAAFFLKFLSAPTMERVGKQEKPQREKVMSVNNISGIDGVVAHLTGVSRVGDATDRPAVRQDKAPVERSDAEAPTAEQLQRLAEDVTSRMDRALSISIHEETGRFVVKVGDGNGEIIRQFPSESALGLYARLEDLRGLLFEGSAA